MPLKDFKCSQGHVHDALVNIHIKYDWCPECGEFARMVFLKPPRLDWASMAQGANAGPEFIDRFDRIHKEKKEKEDRSWKEHGDYGSGYSDIMPRQPGED